MGYFSLALQIQKKASSGFFNLKLLNCHINVKIEIFFDINGGGDNYSKTTSYGWLIKYLRLMNMLEKLFFS